MMEDMSTDFRDYIDVPICITNKCPNCNERYLSDGYDSVTVGEKVECYLCGKDFEIDFVENVIGQRKVDKHKLNKPEPEITDPRATIIECLDKLSRATKMLLEIKLDERK